MRRSARPRASSSPTRRRARAATRKTRERRSAVPAAALTRVSTRHTVGRTPLTLGDRRGSLSRGDGMHTRRLVVTVALMSVGSLGVGPAGAAKPACAIDNEGTHTEYATLQAAVDAASPGATLEIKGVCAG